MTIEEVVVTVSGMAALVVVATVDGVVEVLGKVGSTGGDVEKY